MTDTTRPAIPAAKPLIGDEERAAVDGVLRSGHARPGPRGRRVRAGVRRRAGRRPHLRRGELGHLGPAPGPARRRRRAGRRGHRPVVHLRRDRELGRAHRGHAGLRRHRARHVLPRPRRGRGSGHRAHGGDHAGAPLRSAGRHDPPAARSPTGTACRSSRTPRRRTAPPGRAGRSARSVRSRMFSLYPTKNMTSGEGGMVSCATDERGPHGPAAAQPGHGAAVRERGRRVQQPDDRHPRRDRAGAAHQARRLDQAAAGERGVPRREPARGRRAAGRCRRDARLPPVHDPGPRGPRRVRHRARARSTASAAASTTRSRTTGCLVRAHARPARDRAGRRARCSRCRCTRR